jgi:hypothetical protein
MRKQFLTLCCFILCPVIALGQTYDVQDDYKINGMVGIGTPTPSSYLDILAKAQNGGESLTRYKVNDALSDYLEVRNGTGDHQQFIPTLYSYRESDDRVGFFLVSAISPEMDRGREPAMIFDSRIRGKVISSRPLFGWDSNGVSKMTLSARGCLGIGTTTPGSYLEVLAKSGDDERFLEFKVEDATTDNFTIVNGTGSANQFIPTIIGTHGTDNRVALLIIGKVPGAMDYGSEAITVFDSRLDSSPVANRPLFAWNSYGQEKMILTADGNLGLGIHAPNHRLEVNGTIRAKEVKVEHANWPDFVFSRDYALRDLGDVEAFIQEHQHLPGIPSQEEVEQQGVGLGEMDRKLLEKIEELTLYVIELKKENQAQQEELERIKKRIEAK